MDIKDFFKKYYYQYLFKLIWALPLFAILISVDWLTKGIALLTIRDINENTTFIKHFLLFRYTVNHGSAYSTNENNLPLTVALAAAGTLFLICASIFVRNKFLIISVTVILSGSFANLVGRLWEPSFGVIDFMTWGFSFGNSLSFLTNYIFNFADMYVNIGVTLLICFVIYLIVDIIKMRVYSKNNQEKYKRIVKYREDFIIINHNYEIEIFELRKIKEKNKRKDAYLKLKTEKIKDLERILRSLKIEVADEE